MIDPTYVRENLPAVREALRRRGINPDQALDALATLLSDRRRIIPEFEELKRQQNASGEEIGRAKRQGLDTTAIQEAGRARAQHIKTLQAQVDAVEAQLADALLTLPNLPHASVPEGRSAEDNVEVEVADDGARENRRLLGMRERVAVYGGELTTSRPDSGGWSVAARLPLEVAT